MTEGLILRIESNHDILSMGQSEQFSTPYLENTKLHQLLAKSVVLIQMHSETIKLSSVSADMGTLKIFHMRILVLFSIIAQFLWCY